MRGDDQEEIDTNVRGEAKRASEREKFSDQRLKAVWIRDEFIRFLLVLPECNFLQMQCVSRTNEFSCV